ncbi:MAG: hypothetical protein IJ848_02525 [Alphaproteobacteria bacterium]|nr:hypothetical protein [Alphaproteobacteria bacterium]
MIVLIPIYYSLHNNTQTLKHDVIRELAILHDYVTDIIELFTNVLMNDTKLNQQVDCKMIPQH